MSSFDVSICTTCANATYRKDGFYAPKCKMESKLGQETKYRVGTGEKRTCKYYMKIG